MQQQRVSAIHARNRDIAYMPEPHQYYREQAIPHMSAAEKKRITKERAGVAPGAKVGRKLVKAWMEADVEAIHGGRLTTQELRYARVEPTKKHCQSDLGLTDANPAANNASEEILDDNGITMSRDDLHLELISMGFEETQVARVIDEILLPMGLGPGALEEAVALLCS